MAVLAFLRQRRKLREAFQHGGIVFAAVGKGAALAVLYALFGVCAVSPAALAQGVQRAIAEQSVEVLRRYALMAGEVLTAGVLKELIVFHLYSHPRSFGSSISAAV
jgi:hypothetical protein